MNTKQEALLLPPPQPPKTFDENYAKQLYNWNLSILGILKTLLSDVYLDITDINDAGYVVGPDTNTDGYVPLWNGANANTLKNGVQLDTDGTLAGNSDTRIASQKAVKIYSDTGLLTKLPAGEAVITYGANITADFITYGTRWCTLTGNTNITLSNLLNGKVYRLILIQGGSGSYVVSSWVTTITWLLGGSAPVLSTAVGAVDVITFLKSNDIIYGAITTA